MRARIPRLVVATLWLGVPALLCVLALFINLARDSGWLRRPERVVTLERRLAALEADLDSDVPVGVWSGGPNMEAHFLAQYALAPRLLDTPAQAPALLLAVTAPEGGGPGAPYRLRRDYGGGLRLYVRAPR